MHPTIKNAEIVWHIGAGAWADVYHVVSRGQEYAAKVPTHGDGSRILREHALLQRMSHPGIVSSEGLTETVDGFPVLLLPRLDPLAAAWPPLLSDRATCQFLRELLDAVDHAHAAGVVHTDVLPQNILSREWAPVLIDFDDASHPEHDDPKGLRRSCIDDEPGAASDTYGVGYCALVALVGRGFDEPEMQTPEERKALHRQAPIPRLPAEVAHWQAFLDKALAKEPADRFQSAREMAAAIPV